MTSLGWSLLAGAIFFALKKYMRSSLIVGSAVFSHWLLDFITHRPDLPLAPGGAARLGLGLWDSLIATIVLEVGIFCAAWYVYVRSSDARSRAGRISLWSWAIFVVAIYFANLFGTPPPNETALAYTALAAWLFVPWGYWIDSQRTMTGVSVPG